MKSLIFSAPMINALIAGRKFQTRRIARLPPAPSHRGGWEPTTFGGPGCTTKPGGEPVPEQAAIWNRTNGHHLVCPYGGVGDKVWVRESWRTHERDSDAVDGVVFAADGAFVPIANSAAAADRWVVAHDNDRHGDKWRSPIFLPMWASRITLGITEVRAQRLLDITEADAVAEGVAPFFAAYPEIGRDQRITTGELARDAERRASYAVAWDTINGDKALWKTNPLVWAVSFAVELKSQPWGTP